MNIDPKHPTGCLVMRALGDKIAALQRSGDNTDHSNEVTAYQAILDELIRERDANLEDQPEWITKGKSITQLIKELGSFEDQTLEVRLTFDGGETHKPISILTRRDGYAMIEYCGL
jgi:hypothetical protein